MDRNYEGRQTDKQNGERLMISNCEASYGQTLIEMDSESFESQCYFKWVVWLKVSFIHNQVNSENASNVFGCFNAATHQLNH